MRVVPVGRWLTHLFLPACLLLPGCTRPSPAPLREGAVTFIGPQGQGQGFLVQPVAAGGPAATLAGQPLTARKAYLLAFHEAQDAGDLEHVLAIADRLDAVDEPDLASHVRHAAAVLLGEVGG